MRYQVTLNNLNQITVEATNFYPNGQSQVVFYREEPRPAGFGGEPWGGERFMRREVAMFSNVESVMMVEEEPVERSVEAGIPL